MNKQHILAEIKRTAQDNVGIPLGWKRFFSETGIRYHDWFGKYWSRWGDAVREAGFEPNKLTEAYGDELLIERYVGLVRDLGRIPVKGELRLKKRDDPSFPNEKAFERFGSKGQLLAKVLEYCSVHSGFDDVAPLCAQLPLNGVEKPSERRDQMESGSNSTPQMCRHSSAESSCRLSSSFSSGSVIRKVLRNPSAFSP